MTLPAKSTSARRLIDLLFSVEFMTVNDIVRTLNDLSRPAIEKMIKKERENGNIVQRNGLALSAEARKECAAEKMAVATTAREFKPLNRSLYMNIKGTRGPSSDWSVYPSVNARLGG